MLKDTKILARSRRARDSFIESWSRLIHSDHHPPTRIKKIGGGKQQSLWYEKGNKNIATMLFVTAKDCKIWICVTFAVALLITMDAFHIASRVVGNKQVVAPSYAYIDSSRWSEAMLRASRSRVSQSILERMEREKLHHQQDRHLLMQQEDDFSQAMQEDSRANDSSDSLSPDSHRYEIMVNLFTTKWQDVAHLVWNHKFVGIFLCRQEPIDYV